MLLHKASMDDKDERKEEKDETEEFRTEEVETPEEHVHEEPDAPEEASFDEVKEDMTEPESTEQPKRFFHSSASQPEIYAGQSREGSGKKIFIVLAVLALLALGAFFYSIRGGSKTTKPSPTPIPLVQSTPTPEPSPSFDRSAHKIRVLNGTSTQGLAASVSAKLKDLGYVIERSGNATNSAFLKTVVRVKSTVEGILEVLIMDLKPDFKAEGGPELKDSDTSDGEIILGKE